MVVAIMKGYTIFVIILMLLYTARHFYFTIVRLLGRQRLYYNDILTDRMKSITVLIPMHNEEQVLSNVLDSLLKCEYDRDRLEIIPINDNSTDRTREMLDEYHRKYEFIRPLHRDCPDRGKPVGLNDAMKLAKGEIIIVFDADYRPARNMLKQIALGFEDPQVGAVMGRVIPYNVIALIVAFFIMFTYKISYAGPAYSRKFNISIGSITIITAMIMSIISNNIALSLGMVGALSIIRFRTAVKDVRDATYIFWAIAAGIGCGVSQYTLIVIGSAFLLLFLIITRKGFTSCNKLLVVQGKPECLHKTEAAVDTFFAGKVHVSMRNVTENSFELVYSIGEGILYKAAKENQMDISEKLIKIDGVKRVNIVDQKDELSQ